MKSSFSLSSIVRKMFRKKQSNFQKLVGEEKKKRKPKQEPRSQAQLELNALMIWRKPQESKDRARLLSGRLGLPGPAPPVPQGCRKRTPLPQGYPWLLGRVPAPNDEP